MGHGMKECQSVRFYFCGTIAHASLIHKARCHRTRKEMCFFHEHEDSITQSILKIMALQKTVANQTDSPPVEFCDSLG